jgi:uncharacterized protein (TIGR02001 family)
MKRLLLASAVASALAAPLATMAADPAPAVTGNMSLVTDYRFRGISQTFKLPALQGGFDYAHSSGLYLGNWNSNVSSYYFPGGANLEMDFYGGYKWTMGDLGLDLGAIYYYYPGAELNGTNANNGNTFREHKFNNGEVYLGGSWKWLTVKYNRAVTNYFGLDDDLAGGFNANRTTTAPLASRGSSKGTGYLDVAASWEVAPKTTVVAHVGRLNVKNYGELNYTDYKLGVTYDMNGWLLGAAAITTNANKDWYYNAGPSKVKDTGTSTLVLSVGKTF